MSKPQRPHEDLANSLTAGLGVAASVAVCVNLVVRASLFGDAWHIVGAAVFGATLIFLYTASTLYHAVRSQRAKARLKVMDHAAIYLLIAGSYTPFTLGDLRGGWGWSLFGVIWGLAACGVVFKLFFTGRFRRISTGIYIGMGWLAVIAIVPMLREMAPVALGWLLAGGVVYTAGTVFYHSRRVPYAHAVWHLFVLGGSMCHAIAVGAQL
jgi:hemolysin III